MYPYRCKRVMGYDIFDAQKKLKRKVIIKRDKLDFGGICLLNGSEGGGISEANLLPTSVKYLQNALLISLGFVEQCHFPV